MTLDGQALIEAHGLDADSLQELAKGAEMLDDFKVLIKHRCQHLTPTGWCDIYDTRPNICRWFVCASRSDCVGCD